LFQELTAATAGKSDVNDRVVHLDLRAGAAAPARAYFVFEGPEKGLRLVGVEHGHPKEGARSKGARSKEDRP